MMTELKAEFDKLDANGVTPASIVYMMTELGVTSENISDESTKQRILNELNEDDMVYADEAGYENAENFYYYLIKDLAAGMTLLYGGHVTQKELYKHVGPGFPRTFFTVALYGIQFYAQSMLMANEALQYSKSIYNTIAVAGYTFNYFKMLHELPAGVDVPTIVTMAAAATNLPQIKQDASFGVQGRDSLLGTKLPDTPSKDIMEKGGSPFKSPFKDIESPLKDSGSPIRPMSSFSDTPPEIVVNPQTPAKSNQIIAPRSPEEQKKIDEFSLNLGKMINRVFGKKEPKTVPSWSDLYDEDTKTKIQMVFNTIQNLGSVPTKVKNQKQDMIRKMDEIFNIDPKKKTAWYTGADAPKFLRELIGLQSSQFTYGKQAMENRRNELAEAFTELLNQKAPQTV
jgi:hypothetical protein